MWLYIGFCISFFYVVKTQSNTPNEPEEIFVDVIKNISRVNNVLQELISNYETLQKIYKSQENIDSKYSDSEMDDLFQNIKKEPRSQTSKATKTEKFAATEMYWSDHEEETKNDDKKKYNKSKEDHKKKENVAHKAKRFGKVKPKSSTTTMRSEVSSSSESFSSSDENVEDMLKNKFKMLPKYAKKNNNKSIAKSKKAQSESENSYSKSVQGRLIEPFIDTSAVETRSRKIYKDEDKLARSALNSSYSVLSDGIKVVDKSKTTKKVKRNLSLIADDTHNVRAQKKKVPSEALPTKKSLFELVKNTPIELEAHSDIFMENVRKPVSNKEKKHRDEIGTQKNKRRDSDKLDKINSKHHHGEEDIDKVAANETHQKLLRTDNVRIAKVNVTHHKSKKNHKILDDDTHINNIDHKKASEDHETKNNNQKPVDTETKSDSKRTQEDNKKADIGYKKAPNDREKSNKRHKKTDIKPETNNPDHEMITHKVEQRGTVAKNKKKKQINKETEVESSNESMFMAKNDTHVLREAYGEACMKVVVRKCYKACTKSSKVVCSQTKCKSNIKSKFKGFAKKACIEYFTAKETSLENVKANLQKDEDLFSHRKALQENLNNVNKGEFHACLPALSVQPEPAPSNQSTNETNQGKRKIKQRATDEKIGFNILRDRFERACKKISYNKCHKACLYSWNNACETFDCSKRLKSLYKKSCKKSCRTAYELKKHSKGSDASSGSSDSSDDNSS